MTFSVPYLVSNTYNLNEDLVRQIEKQTCPMRNTKKLFRCKTYLLLIQFVLIIVQDNGGAGVVVTTSQTISSDAMVSKT